MPPELDQVLEEEPIADADDDTPADADASDGADATAHAPGADAEVEITIGDDEPEPEQPEKAPSWVADLRKRNRELAKELREAKASKAQPAQQQAPSDPGPMPKQSDADIDYDGDKYAAKLLEWTERKRRHEEAQREAEAKERAVREAWQKTLNQYEAEKKALKVQGYADAEAAVQDVLSTVQQGIIIQGADNRAQIVYALGRNTKRLQELAGIDDPVKFAIEIGKVSALMKVTTRKPTVQPETGVRGGSPGVQQTSSKSDALLKKAQASGDYTEYFRAQRAARAKK